MKLEQTVIAKRLGMSNTTFRKMVHTARLEFELINNKRHYEWEEVLEVIPKSNFGKVYRE